MKLSELCKNIEYICIQGEMSKEIEGIAYDSRKVGEHFLFVCLVGALCDGHRYIADAVRNGAEVIVLEELCMCDVPDNITVIQMKSTRRGLALLSANFFGNPAECLTTIGITGTKGKTTISYMIKSILEEAGEKVGLIGTLGALVASEKVPVKNTTPESYEIQRLLRRMVDSGCRYAVMEVSSQGLKQHRVEGICFDYGIFTNLSPDHISPAEHASFQEYLECKRKLFGQCRTGIINIDDPYWKKITENHTCKIRTYSLSKQADLEAVAVEYLKEEGKLGMQFVTDGCVTDFVQVHIPGRFSVHNALAAMLVCHLSDIGNEEILSGISKAFIRGRAELASVSEDFAVVIDYAHNELSTKSILDALLEYKPRKLFCLFGCGGNRPKLRRFAMGKTAGELADLCILTCDNPRDEELCEINADIKEGLAQAKHSRYIEIYDREKAIHYCLEHAPRGSIVALLGKGHEDYQEIRGIKHHFDEREILAEWKEKREVEPGNCTAF